MSASERLKLKKAGKSLDDFKGSAEKVTELTELANKILNATGNMDIYQETYEYIKEKVRKKKALRTHIIMYKVFVIKVIKQSRSEI